MLGDHAGIPAETADGVSIPHLEAPDVTFDALLLSLVGMTANPVADPAIAPPAVAGPTGQTLDGAPVDQPAVSPTAIHESGLIAVHSLHSERAFRQAALQLPLPHRLQSVPLTSAAAASSVGAGSTPTHPLPAAAMIEAETPSVTPADTQSFAAVAASPAAISANPNITPSPADWTPSIPAAPAPTSIPQGSPVAHEVPPPVGVPSGATAQSVSATERIHPDEVLRANSGSALDAAPPQLSIADRTAIQFTVPAALSASLPAPADVTESATPNAIRFDAVSTMTPAAHSGAIAAAAQVRLPVSEPTLLPGSVDDAGSPVEEELEVATTTSDGSVEVEDSTVVAESLPLQRRGATTQAFVSSTPNEVPAAAVFSVRQPLVPAVDEVTSPSGSAVPHTVAQTPPAWSAAPAESAASVAHPQPQSDAGSPPSVSRQVSDAIVAWRSVAAEQGTARFSAWLSPPELGQVWIQLTRTSRGISARLSAVEEGVQSLLEEKAPQLRQSLSDSGVTLSDLDVSSGLGRESQDGSGNTDSPAYSPESKSMRAAQPSAAGARHQGTINIRA